MSERMTKNNKKKGIKKHGFLKRSASASGRNVLKRQQSKGRHSA
ncbi:MAG TPA: bL34 family ribosomal protein [Candidatus Levybacteria bacterium]|nr:bL34 family ribosomal protein [Candidatus Levybacteria bacterium]